MKNSIKIGDTVKVNMSELKKYSKVSSFHKLINNMLKRGNDSLYVYGLSDDGTVAFVKANKNDFAHDVEIGINVLYKEDNKLTEYIEKRVYDILTENQLNEYSNTLSIDDKKVFDYIKDQKDLYLLDLTKIIIDAYKNKTLGQTLSGLPSFYLKKLYNYLDNIKDSFNSDWNFIFDTLSHKI